MLKIFFFVDNIEQKKENCVNISMYHHELCSILVKV